MENEYRGGMVDAASITGADYAGSNPVDGSEASTA